MGALSVRLDDVRVVRFSADASLRAIAHPGPASLAFEAGPTLSWVDISGRDIPYARGEWHVQGGARAGFVVRLDTGVVAPYVALWGEWAAPAWRIALVPDGPVGALPSVWLGVSLGLSIRLATLSH